MPRDAKTDAYEFLWINVNKKSVALNLKTGRGVDLARQLITRADVLVENYQKGIMERFGLDYDSIRALTPADLLVLARIRRVGTLRQLRQYGGDEQQHRWLDSCGLGG